VITRNRKPWQTATNTMVNKKSEKRLRKSCNRYNAMSQYLSSNNGSLSTMEAFNILRNVSIEGAYSSQFDIYSSTQWSVLYNLDKRNIDVVFRRNYDNVYHYELNK
ncbi:MAG: hypothetical protein KAX05_01935, partial [Bacteroidales bacterium]|nr:hypothetical protein [Bacteroidales bacterium]